MFLKPKYIRNIPQGVTKVDMAIQRERQSIWGYTLYYVYIRNEKLYRAVSKSSAYTSAEELGYIDDALDCAIVFNGRYEERLFQPGWEFLTEGTPYVFWIQAITNKLLCRRWDQGHIIELDTNVSSLSAVRGWQASEFPTNDQGMIISYIKNGQAFYRTFAWQNYNEFFWELPRPLVMAQNDLYEIKAFKTNDYRVGFITQSSASTRIFFTTSVYPGLGLENQRLSLDIQLPVFDLLEVIYTDIEENGEPNIGAEHVALNIELPVFDLLYATTNQNAIIHIENVLVDDEWEGEYWGNWGRRIELSIKQPNYSESVGTFLLVDSNSTVISINSVTKISPTQYVLDTADFNYASGLDITVSYIAGHNNEAGYQYEPYSKLFTPINLELPEVPIPEVEVIWNE